jgi:SNF2 family DNA or RNA helicase
MDPSAGATAAATNSTTGTPQQNLQELQALFDQFTQTLVQLRAITTEGQQKIETARARPQ